MLTALEQQIENEDELQDIQKHLKDYETLTELAEIMQFIFKQISSKLREPAPRYFKSEPKHSYQKLEQVIQKYEQEIRVHIRVGGVVI